MYCALLVTGIVITSEKSFKFLANGWLSSGIDVKIYPTYTDYEDTVDSSSIPTVSNFSFNMDKVVASWKS